MKPKQDPQMAPGREILDGELEAATGIELDSALDAARFGRLAWRFGEI